MVGKRTLAVYPVALFRLASFNATLRFSPRLVDRARLVERPSRFACSAAGYPRAITLMLVAGGENLVAWKN